MNATRELLIQAWCDILGHAQREDKPVLGVLAETALGMIHEAEEAENGR